MRKSEQAVIYVVLTVGAVLAVLPAFILYVLAFTGREYGGSTSGFAATAATFSNGVHLDNFLEVFTTYQWSVSVVNTVITAVGVAALTMAVSLPAAYSLARLRPKGGTNLAIWLVGIRLGPPVAFVLPIYLLFSNPNISLLDTTQGLILAQSAFAIPFAIWLLSGFFKDVPPEYEEAALVDGCSRIQAFTKVFLHLAIAGIITTTVFVVILSWGDYLFPTILTSRNAITMPYAVSLTRTEIGEKWGTAAVLSLVDSIPLIALVLAIQKYFVRGLTFGAIKG